jgi:hypothetical protein
VKFDTQTCADYAAVELDFLLQRAARDTAEVAEQGDIPAAVTYFAELRTIVDSLQAQMSSLQSHIKLLSTQILPTMFTNQDVKTIHVTGVGRVTINIKWSASMTDKEAGMDWLRTTGNDGLIIETVNAQTLTAFAKEEMLRGKPLPEAIFKISTAPYTSVTEV